jgi:hypothetical protein
MKQNLFLYLQQTLNRSYIRLLGSKRIKILGVNPKKRILLHIFPEKAMGFLFFSKGFSPYLAPKPTQWL